MADKNDNREVFMTKEQSGGIKKILEHLVKETHRKDEFTDYKLDDWDREKISKALSLIKKIGIGKEL